MKKFIAIILAGMLCMGGMTSCKKATENTNGEVSKSETKANTKNYGLEYDKKKLENGVIAVVDDEKITKEEIEFFIAQSVLGLYSQMGITDTSTKEDKDAILDKEYQDGLTYREFIYKNAVDNLVKMTVLANMGKKMGIDYSDEALKKKYDEEGITEQKKTIIEQYGLTDAGIDAVMKKQFIYADYQQQYLKDDERMNPSDETLKSYFSENFIKAKHILKLTQDQETQTPFDDKKKAEIKTKVDEILKKVKGGEDFDKMVEKESEDPGSKQQPEGYVFTEGEMVQEFYEGAKALKLDEISDIVETSYGYHIIKRVALEDKDFTDNKEKVSSAYQGVAFENLIKDEMSKMKIHVDYKQLSQLNEKFYINMPKQEPAPQPETEPVQTEEQAEEPKEAE